MKRRKRNYPYTIFDHKKFQENTIYKTNQGYNIRILEYFNSRNATIQFIDNGLIVYNVDVSSILKGNIKNPYHPNKYGAYFGVGKYNSKDYRYTYDIWKGMNRRTHTSETYKNSIVCEEWLDYQNFAAWHHPRIISLNPEFIYNLDKDIKQIGKYPKIYSPDTCCIVPKYINFFLEGLYIDKESNLPIGVVADGTHFAAKCKIDGVTTYLGTGITPMEAFVIYKNYKLNRLRELALYYYNLNALLLEDYNAIINMDILPYNN